MGFGSHVDHQLAKHAHQHQLYMHTTLVQLQTSCPDQSLSGYTKYQGHKEYLAIRDVPGTLRCCVYAPGRKIWSKVDNNYQAHLFNPEANASS